MFANKKFRWIKIQKSICVVFSQNIYSVIWATNGGKWPQLEKNTYCGTYRDSNKGRGNLAESDWTRGTLSDILILA